VGVEFGAAGVGVECGGGRVEQAAAVGAEDVLGLVLQRQFVVTAVGDRGVGSG